MALPGSAATLWFSDVLRLIADQLIVGGNAAPPVAYDGVAAETNDTVPALNGNLFALFVGKQHLKNWLQADVCVLVPTEAIPIPLAAFRSVGMRKPLCAIGQGVEIHVWGREIPDAIRRDTITWDIERYRPAGDILQNVLRAFYFACSYASFTLDTFSGWDNTTEVLPYGEAYLAKLSVGLPIYDFAENPIPLPQKLVPRITIKSPGEL